jgi:RNA 2',3'-cyclic 3'-phosphodiesterase
MKRLFIAVRTNPDKNFGKLYSSLRKELEGESIKWINPENIHLTLMFLGDTDESRIPGIERILKSVCNRTQNFEISLKGFGVFKNISDPKVAWAGLYHSDKLATLQGSLAQQLMEAGFKIDDKPFVPHVTIGRIKNIKDHDRFKMTMLKYHITDIQRVPVTEVILFESILKQEGAVYKQVSAFSLT